MLTFFMNNVKTLVIIILNIDLSPTYWNGMNIHWKMALLCGGVSYIEVQHILRLL